MISFQETISKAEEVEQIKKIFTEHSPLMTTVTQIVENKRETIEKRESYHQILANQKALLEKENQKLTRAIQKCATSIQSEQRYYSL